MMSRHHNQMIAKWRAQQLYDPTLPVESEFCLRAAEILRVAGLKDLTLREPQATHAPFPDTQRRDRSGG
jgi:hypothetical protein